ncbi:MAG: PAS-domain containing protein [Variibacter sp.]|nr:PAS-domain containing protein [Variibacter sp.]
MPDSIRNRAGGPHLRTLGSGILALLAALPGGAQPARADPLLTQLALISGFEAHTVAGLALTFGALAFAVVTAVLLVRSRAKAAGIEAQARAEIATLRSEVDRSVALLTAEPQVFVIWDAADEEPEFIGDVAAITATPVARRLLAFGAWLPPENAQAVEHAVAALRSRGEPFLLSAPTSEGRQIEIEGRAIGGRAILRLKDVGGAALALAQLRNAHARLIAETEPLRMLAEGLPAPVWMRDQLGRLSWTNQAYAQAVEAASPADAVARGVELLDSGERAELEQARATGRTQMARMPAVVAGHRRVLDVLDLPTGKGSAGIGIDVTEIETLRAELAHMIEAHRRTLDQLPTAVAIFSAGQRLTFCNAAYRALWELDADFLEGQPTDSAILDRLRAARKLPEQLDFRQWRNQLFEAYRALEPKEHWWHLPDGRALRVVTTPNPEGGITYVFDDVTERLDLERRYDSLIRVQGETLENLVEAVVVFGSDGRMRLHNSAFVKMWNIPALQTVGRPHIEAIVEAARPLHDDAEFWEGLRGAVAGLDTREPMSKRLERVDGSVVDCATVPLPDGATLVCFQDVTDTVNVERALRERNDALEAADHLKNDFVHHVSYELRTPLTNIIGFAHLLRDLSIGPLTDKQREYLGYISSSSGALLAIINDILDLASIDAGAMQLDLGAVDIRKTMDAAAEGVRDRLAEQGLTLDIQADAEIGRFTADERRIRQILFNLLSNAIAFSQPGGTITLAAERRPGAVVFAVADRGRGIPREIVERVFNRFETHSLGSQHRGAGLGLSIVRSFVELHGGAVTLDSAEGKGTTVTCIFPLEHDAGRVAAE